MLTLDLRSASKREVEAILKRSGVDLAGTSAKASDVISAVRSGGDAALLDFAERFDGFRGGPLTVPVGDVKRARKSVSDELLGSIRTAKLRIEAFHRRQRIGPFEFKDDCGMLGQLVVPLERIGVYVPGGTADYISTVLMAVIPARIAGVREIALCTPGRGGKIPASILAAADMCGVKEVHPVGGAQAIAALAYGTESIPKVQKIVGPGGVFVTAAKLLVRNDCEIDFQAGPSEVLIIADSRARPEFLASDMLAQLEHDPVARAVLVTDSDSVLSESETELRRQMKTAARSEIVSRAAEHGAVFVRARSIGDAISFANSYAPEHLLIDTRDPRTVLVKIKNAGSVFLGSRSSVAFGDYCAGTNHILPTSGAASSKSCLSVYDFLKVIPYQSTSANGARKLAPVVGAMARAEGLPAHAAAASLRSGKVVK